jgi:CHAT domain-containing protein
MKEALSFIDESSTLMKEALSFIDESSTLIDEFPTLVKEVLSFIDESPILIDESPTLMKEVLSFIDESPILIKEALYEQQGIRNEQQINHSLLLQSVNNRLNHPYYRAPFCLIGNGLLPVADR